MPSLTAKIHGKKFMWDNFIYSAEVDAKEKMAVYENDGFETACLSEPEGYLVYTRKVITEITLE